MRRAVVGAFLIFVLSVFSTAEVLAATNTTQPKKIPPKIDIKKVTMEYEVKSVVPSGTALAAVVDVNASEDIAAKLDVKMELKKAKEKQEFKYSIDKLSKGLNSFKWNLAPKPEDGAYTLSVEITCREPKLKDRSTKSFRVVQNATTTAKPPAKTETKVTKTTKSTTTKSGTGSASNATDEVKEGDKGEGEEEGEEEDSSKPDIGIVGGDEEDHDTSDINVTGQSVKQLTIAGITFEGNFVKQPNGDYLVQGDIVPKGFKISIGKAAGQLIVSKDRSRISGEMYIKVIGFGKVIQITDFIIDSKKPQIKFRGKFEEKVTIPVIHADVSLAKGLADFEVSKSRLACAASGGVIIDVSVPKVGALSFDVLSGDAGFQTSIPPEGISVSGSGTVTIPFEPPIEVELEGSAEITKKSVSGKGSATIFSILEIGNGDFEIGYDGVMKINANVGAFLSDYGIEANMADTDIVIDLPNRLLTASLKQSIRVLDLIDIPGSVKGNLTVDGKAKMMSVSGNAKVPLTGSAIGPDQLSVGIQNFLIKVTNYNTSARAIELNGELAVSVWTLGGFNGKVKNAILEGTGNFYLPPGLKQLLDMEKVSLPVKVDLRSASMIGDLGGDVAGLAIKHFPLEGPKIIVKNDGVHLKGQIGIANVITVPLGDLVFTQTSSHTTVNGDLGIGPFTVAEGSFTLPKKDTDGIGFSGKMGIPGLTSQRINGTVYKEGKVDLSGVTKIGFITVDALTKFDVSKTGLHSDRAGLSVGLGGLAKCALAFSSLDISKSGITGQAVGTFSNVLGVDASLRGNFSFDGETVVLNYPDSVKLCGIDVGKATLRVNTSGVTGSGTISAAGKTKTVSITIENGVMKLRGPAGELIAEGMRIADKLADTTAEIASEEKKVVAEDAEGVIDNLSRMTEPWAKEVATVARAAKNVFNTIEKVVVDAVTEKVKAALDDLKKAVDAAVAFAKAAIAAAVDAVCDGIIALIDGVRSIFTQIESKIPAGYVSQYNTVKNKVIEKANALKTKVTEFRDNTKASLYDLTGTITAIYQGAIDFVTKEANAVASKIKKELEPQIKEIDQLLTEIGQEIDAATSAAGDEAKRHYDIAKQKADIVKKRSSGIINKYKDKIGDLVDPYTKPIIDKISADKAKVTKARDEVISKALDDLAKAKKTLDPYVQPFEDAVKELKNLAGIIGGEVFQKFLAGVGAAGDAMDAALGTAGKGLVKATDIIGDAAVAGTGIAADASQAAYEAASATVNFVQDTGSKAVNVAVDTAQAGYQTASQAANQAANAASQAASQAYNTASQVSASAQRQVSSTVNTVINNLPSIPPSSFATGSPISFSDIQSGAQAISAKVSSILNTLDSYATSAYNSASSTASSVGSAISGGVSSRWKSATRSISSLFGSSNPAPAPTVDYTAPEVTNIAATSTISSITVTWNTSRAARTLIFYGQTPNLSFRGQDANTSVASIHTLDYYPETTSHSITVSGLNSGTAYYYIVYAVSMTSDGNTTFAAKKGPYLVVTQPSTAIIGGVVKDASGNVLSGAGIYLGQATTAVATTDATGRYTLEVNPGSQTVKAKKDNYLSSSATTPSLIAGQILPLDFTLADGRIYISGTVKDVTSNTGIGSATVMLTGLPTNISVPTAANGTFTVVLGTTGTNSVQFTMSVEKADYTAYTSSQITLAPGAKMQNLEIKLPHVMPALTTAGVGAPVVTPNQATISFATQKNCSAFVQLALQTSASYTYQTPTQSNKSSFSFVLVGLNPSTAYKHREVLQDGSGNTVIANEGTFTTSAAVSQSTDIGLNATVTNIAGTSAKFNITSSFNILKHQLVLTDTTTNAQIMNQDMGLQASPVSFDLNNLIDGHSYKADLTSSLLANVTSGNVIKTATKSVTFQVPALPSIVISNYNVTPDSPKRGTTTTVNASASIRINHPVNGAILKVTTGSKELCSQSLGNLSSGQMQISVPLALNAIPGTGPVGIQLKIQAGNIQESKTSTINITGSTGPGAQGSSGTSSQAQSGKPKAI